ncbi:MAG: lytic transglycosylase domain-containing protein [Enterobacterales bacterium]|nr:lytic transglycosylase domain-containing protein [Enterobacterales bacterium]
MVIFDLPDTDISAQTIMQATAKQFAGLIDRQKQKLPYCIKQAAKKYQLSELLLKALLKQEGGAIGQVMRHSNGSVDYGPFQINRKFWLSQIIHQYPDLTWVELAFDACTNTFVASAILRSEIDKAQGDIWRGVGNYHHAESSNLVRHYEYTSGVIQQYVELVQQKMNHIFVPTANGNQ